MSCRCESATEDARISQKMRAGGSSPLPPLEPSPQTRAFGRRGTRLDVGKVRFLLAHVDFGRRRERVLDAWELDVVDRGPPRRRAPRWCAGRRSRVSRRARCPAVGSPRVVVVGRESARERRARVAARGRADGERGEARVGEHAAQRGRRRVALLRALGVVDRAAAAARSPLHAGAQVGVGSAHPQHHYLTGHPEKQARRQQPAKGRCSWGLYTTGFTG